MNESLRLRAIVGKFGALSISFDWPQLNGPRANCASEPKKGRELGMPDHKVSSRFSRRTQHNRVQLPEVMTGGKLLTISIFGRLSQGFTQHRIPSQ